MDRSPEFELLVEACRAAFEGRRLDALVLDRPVDWTRFVRLARFHRVQGLAWQSLAGSELPAQAARDLMGDAQSIAQANLRTAVDCDDILQAFERAGVHLVFVKGLTLAALAYGTIATKAAIDIDLLVARSALNKAAGILRDLGYGLDTPRNGYDRLEAWHISRKESAWRHRSRGSLIDLHTSLSDNKSLIPKIGMGSPTQFVKIASDVCLPTLAHDELFAYLCVHGGWSSWFRLKWITDFAALLSHDDPDDVEELYVRSQRLGAGRTASQALLLADALYGSLSHAPALRNTLLQDRAAAWLCRAALWQLSGRDEPTEPTSRPLGTARIHFNQFVLLPSWRLRASELVHQARIALTNAAASEQ